MDNRPVFIPLWATLGVWLISCGGAPQAKTTPKKSVETTQGDQESVPETNPAPPPEPEFLEDNEMVKDEPWFPLLKEKSSKDHALLIKLAPNSYIIVFRRGVLN